MPPTTLHDLAQLPDRIAASAQHVADLRAELKNAEQARNELITAARDEAGLPWRDIAKASQLSVPQVIRIVSLSSED